MKSKSRLSIAVLSGIIMLMSGVFISSTMNTKAAVKISSNKVILIKGQKKQLRIKGTKKVVKWSSTRKKVAEVTSKGTVKAKSKGQAVITGKIGKKNYRCRITVEEPKLNKRELRLKEKQTGQLKLTRTSGKVKWKSSRGSVATVSSKGLVRAKASGSTTISAIVRGKKYSCKVIVSKPDTLAPQNVKPTGITLNKNDITLENGAGNQLSATVAPSNTTDKRLLWKSSNSLVASVDANGKIQANGPGTAVISVICQGVSASCRVTVAPEEPSISIRLYVGAGFQKPTGILDVRIINHGKKPLSLNNMIVLKTDLVSTNLHMRMYGQFISNYTVSPFSKDLVQISSVKFEDFMVNMKSTFLFNITYDGVSYIGEADYYGEKITLKRAGYF